MVFLSNYIILDTQMRGEVIKASIDVVYDLEELTSARIQYPDVTSVAFTIRGLEYEAKCGTQAHAKDFMARLEAIMNEKSVLFRRLVLQNRGKPDAYENYEPEFTPFFNITPKIKLRINEVLWEAGAYHQGIAFVMAGSMMLMNGDRIVKVVKQGQFVGLAEHILDLPSQFTVKARSKGGAWVVHIAASLLLSRLKGDPMFAVHFYQFMSRQATTQLYLRLISRSPTAVFAHEVEVDTPPGFDPVGDVDKEEDEEDAEENRKKMVETVYVRDMKMVKLLKLRKSEFLQHIDDAGINLLAGGMGIMKLSRGTFLMKQGDKVQDSAIDSMYLIKSGLVSYLKSQLPSQRTVLIDDSADFRGVPISYSMYISYSIFISDSSTSWWAA